MSLFFKRIESSVLKYPTLVLIKQYVNFKLIIFSLIIGFSSCKSSTQQQTHREYNEKLIRSLQTLGQKYAGKKVRINTWDKKNNAYLDIQVLNEDHNAIGTLTIGDSVRFVVIDLSRPDGIEAKIKLNNNTTGYIPYFNIEEFEPATLVDSNLKN